MHQCSLPISSQVNHPSSVQHFILLHEHLRVSSIMLLSVLLWTSMIQSTSLVYRGTLRLVVSQGCFPPIGPWTYTATDTSLVSRDVKGPSLWGSSPLGGSGGQRCPEPFYIHHCSPSPSGMAVLPALCTIHLTYWEHISVSQLHIFFLPATSLPLTLSVRQFP